MLVPEYDDRPSLDEAGQTLKTRRGQGVRRNHGDPSFPEIAQDGLQRHPAGTGQLIAPNCGVPGQIRDRQRRVTKVPQYSLGDLERCIDGGSQPIPR